MKLVHWDPFQDLVGRTFGRAPAVDIFEKEDRLVLRAEVPGVPKENLDVSIENGVLTLHGERKQESDIAEGDVHLMERSYGSFTRSFSLPTTVDAAKIAASYKDGVLEITVPKAETAKAKKIDIKAA